VGARLTAFGSVIGPAKVDFNGGQTQPTETNCDTPVSVSLGFNVVTEGSCRLAAPTDLVGVPSDLGPLVGNGGPAETRLPLAASPVLDHVSTDACLNPPMPEQLEGEQHLDGLVDDLRALLRTDQRGVPRPQGPACDAGAVEVAK
jgi:hypothetical protein